MAFTNKARQKLLFTIRNTVGLWASRAILSYPDGAFPSDGRLVKRALDKFLHGYRCIGGRHFIWKLEFKRDGTPHFHILFETTPSEHWLREAWARAIGRDTGTAVAETIDAPEDAFYLVKRGDSSKNIQHEPPAGYTHIGHFWGKSQHLVGPQQEIELDEQSGRIVRDFMARKIVERRRGKKPLPYWDPEGEAGVHLFYRDPKVMELLTYLGIPLHDEDGPSVVSAAR